MSRMLTSGYLPKELPPPFTSFPFSNWATRNRIPVGNLGNGYATQLVEHSLARPGANRRVLGIPNPINQQRLVQAIEENYDEVMRLARSSPISVGKPSFTRKGKRAMKPQFESALLQHKARTRVGARYLMQADISRFYPNIYTHSLSWALHTKSVAKARRHDMTLCGNLIDKIVRQSQHDQTLGLPIGPDTSFLLAEAILADVDTNLSTEKCVGGIRWFDDYDITFYDRDDADRYLVALERALREYELELNSEKLRIEHLPVIGEPSWVREIRAVEIPRQQDRQAEAIISIFDIAFAAARVNVKEGSMKYAIRKLHSAAKEYSPQTPLLHAENWALLQDLCLQCALLESDTVPYVLGLFSFFSSQGFAINMDRMGQTLDRVIVMSASRGFASDTAWALWGLIENGIPVVPDTFALAEETGDDIVSCLLLDILNKGLVPTGTATPNITRIVTESDFCSSHWLVAYESSFQGWMAAPETDELRMSADAQRLLADGVHFYRAHTRPYESARHVYGTPDFLYPLLPKATP